MFEDIKQEQPGDRIESPRDVELKENDWFFPCMKKLLVMCPRGNHDNSD
jgi:hypothetical protein